MRDDGKIIIELLANTENCIIKIRDNGLGISPELTDKIFKPYFTTKSSGLGLGLAIVKSIIIDMGGQITLCFGCRCRNHLYYHIAAKEKFLVLKRNIPIFPWFESMHL